MLKLWVFPSNLNGALGSTIIRLDFIYLKFIVYGGYIHIKYFILFLVSIYHSRFDI